MLQFSTIPWHLASLSSDMWDVIMRSVAQNVVGHSNKLAQHPKSTDCIYVKYFMVFHMLLHKRDLNSGCHFAKG